MGRALRRDGQVLAPGGTAQRWAEGGRGESSAHLREAPLWLLPEEAALEGRAGSTSGSPRTRPHLPAPAAALGPGGDGGGGGGSTPGCASGHEAKAGGGGAGVRGGGSRRGRWPAPAEPWRPRSQRLGGAGSGSGSGKGKGRTKARTRATSWRKARVAAGKSGGSRWARREWGDAMHRNKGWEAQNLSAASFLHPFDLPPRPW